ncbi:hypothetical protein ACIQU6_27775 [Streptomyces sp. NPDC090442]|uniref:hypothetical protein n=1 Tax=Streptomyces sp. NPDC090442 TaxID=3365962 RepID=UPI00382719F4
MGVIALTFGTSPAVPPMSLAGLTCELVATRRDMSVCQRVRAARPFTVVRQLTNWILKEGLQKADWNA